MTAAVPHPEEGQDTMAVQIHTRSSLLAFSPRLLRTFSTRARRPERESKRFTTLSKSPMNILYLSNSLGLHSLLINSSTSSPRALFILMSASRPSLASFRISSLWVKLPMSSACQKGNTLSHRSLPQSPWSYRWRQQEDMATVPEEQGQASNSWQRRY